MKPRKSRKISKPLNSKLFEGFKIDCISQTFLRYFRNHKTNKDSSGLHAHACFKSRHPEVLNMKTEHETTEHEKPKKDTLI